MRSFALPRCKRPVILVGHSTGGLDALLYARRYTSDIDGLVLVDSPSESAPPRRGRSTTEGPGSTSAPACEPCGTRATSEICRSSS